MNIYKTFDEIITYGEANPVIAAAAGAVLLYLIIKKPKMTFGVIVVILFLAAVMHLISRLFESATF